jgi:cyanophycinase
VAGPVALLGSGEFLPGMEALDRRLLDGRASRVVHLPTAAGQESGRRLRHWRDLAHRHFTERLGVVVETLDVLDPQSANDRDHADRIQSAGLIYFSGGNPGYLAAALRGTWVLESIRQAWFAGAALAGCSAGAAALTSLAPDVRSGDGESAGLGVVPGLAIIPHYDAILRRRSLARLFAAAPDGVATIGVDEHTAIVSDDLEHWEVYGIGRAVLVANGSVYGPGDRFRV